VRWQSVQQAEEVQERAPSIASFPFEDPEQENSTPLSMISNSLPDTDEDDDQATRAESPESARQTVANILEDVKSFYTLSEDGSQMNLGFTDVESEGSCTSSGWVWKAPNTSNNFDRQSKSFIDRTRRFVRRSQERLSLSEINRKSSLEGCREPRFLRLTEPHQQNVIQNRASLVDSPVSEIVHIPRRPSSVISSCKSSLSSRTGLDRHSLRTRYGSPACMMPEASRFDGAVNIFILP